MTLANYVILKPEVEKILRLENPRIEERRTRDPDSKREKTSRVWAADVVEEDYRPVTKTFSTMSEKLAGSLEAARLAGELTRYRVGITRYGSGYATEYRMRLIP